MNTAAYLLIGILGFFIQGCVCTHQYYTVYLSGNTFLVSEGLDTESGVCWGYYEGVFSSACLVVDLLLL